MGELNEEAAIADLHARVSNLEGWQKSQHGDIRDVNAKVDRLLMWIIGNLAATVLAAIAVIVRIAMR